MREFQPPVRGGTMRTVLAVVIVTVIAGAMVPLLLVALGARRITYALEQGTLTVDSGSWLDGHRDVPLSLVRDARAVTLSGARRTRGTGLPGACTGRWSYAGIGTVWQATDCSSRAVLLTTSDGDLPVVVTPPDREAFLNALDERIDFEIELPPPDTTPLEILAVAVVLLSLGGCVMLFVTLVLGPSRMVYRVGGGRLEVRTVFGRRTWPASSLRAHAHAARLQLRLMGTAVRGYYTGYYLADGKRTRVYATDPSAGVLIEGPSRILLSPADRAGFLEALRAEGATIED